MKNFLAKAVFMLAGLMLLSSCALPIKLRDMSYLFWPKPPDETKIKYVWAVNSNMDVKKLSRAERLFGFEISFTFVKPSDIAADKRGIIYVTDQALNAVVTIDREKGILSYLNTPGLTTPTGIGYNEDLDLLAVTETGGQKRVLVFEMPKAKLKFVIGQKGEFVNPVDAAIDSRMGRIYVVDSKLHQILVFDLNGKHIMNIGKIGTGEGGLFYPISITLDKEGRIYVVDSMNFRLQIFESDGQPVKTIGQHGDRPGMFARPKGIALDSEGHIYITDAAFGNFQIMSPNGDFHMDVGSNGTDLGQFSVPQGISIDGNDRIYVVDQMNRRIQIFQYLSEKYKQAHPEEVLLQKDTEKTAPSDEDTAK